MTTTRHQWEGIAAAEGCGGALVLDCVVVGNHGLALVALSAGHGNGFACRFFGAVNRPLAGFFFEDASVTRLATADAPAAWGQVITQAAALRVLLNQSVEAVGHQVIPDNLDYCFHLSALRFHWLGVCFDVDDASDETLVTKDVQRLVKHFVTAVVLRAARGAIKSAAFARISVLLRLLHISHPIAENHVCHGLFLWCVSNGEQAARNAGQERMQGGQVAVIHQGHHGHKPSADRKPKEEVAHHAPSLSVELVMLSIIAPSDPLRPLPTF